MLLKAPKRDPNVERASGATFKDPTCTRREAHFLRSGPPPPHRPLQKPWRTRALDACVYLTQSCFSYRKSYTCQQVRAAGRKVGRASSRQHFGVQPFWSGAETARPPQAALAGPADDSLQSRPDRSGPSRLSGRFAGKPQRAQRTQQTQRTSCWKVGRPPPSRPSGPSRLSGRFPAKSADSPKQPQQAQRTQQTQRTSCWKVGRPQQADSADDSLESRPDRRPADPADPADSADDLLESRPDRPKQPQQAQRTQQTQRTSCWKVG